MCSAFTYSVDCAIETCECIWKHALGCWQVVEEMRKYKLNMPQFAYVYIRAAVHMIATYDWPMWCVWVKTLFLCAYLKHGRLWDRQNEVHHHKRSRNRMAAEFSHTKILPLMLNLDLWCGRRSYCEERI